MGTFVMQRAPNMCHASWSASCRRVFAGKAIACRLMLRMHGDRVEQYGPAERQRSTREGGYPIAHKDYSFERAAPWMQAVDKGGSIGLSKVLLMRPNMNLPCAALTPLDIPAQLQTPPFLQADRMLAEVLLGASPSGIARCITLPT